MTIQELEKQAWAYMQTLNYKACSFEYFEAAKINLILFPPYTHFYAFSGTILAKPSVNEMLQIVSIDNKLTEIKVGLTNVNTQNYNIPFILFWQYSTMLSNTNFIWNGLCLKIKGFI